MILSVSRRTDIPCCYGEWFLHRLREGYVLVRNPMNHAQVSRVPLSPALVDGIVFWTKDAQNFLSYLQEIDKMGYRYYFQFTLTPYGHDLEPGLRPKAEILQTFLDLSDRIGKERVLWRYDPIILNDEWTAERHVEAFARLCDLMSPYTQRVTISFVDQYKKIRSAHIRPLTEEEILLLGERFGRIAAEHRLPIVTCCEEADLSAFGIGHGSCIDAALLERLCGCPLDIAPDKNQRGGCGCVKSIDIGTYNTCPNGCLYCYANRSAASAVANYKQHDPKSPLLCDRLAEGETPRERNVKTHKRLQQTLPFL